MTVCTRKRPSDMMTVDPALEYKDKKMRSNYQEKIPTSPTIITSFSTKLPKISLITPIVTSSKLSSMAHHCPTTSNNFLPQLEDYNKKRSSRRPPIPPYRRTQSDSAMQYQKPRTLPSISRLLTTQFALGGLQASETIFLFRTIQKAHQELRTLCESRPSDAPLHSVFGWSHSLWGRRINYNSLEDQIVWRGAKVFEHVGVDQLSRSIWGVCKKKTLEAFPQIKSIKTLYDINDSVRIVQCIEKLFGRQEQQTLRLVFKLRNKNYTYIGCKEIANFREYDSHSPPNDHEVMGFFIRENLTKINDHLVKGCVLHTICSISTRKQGTVSTYNNILSQLPSYVLEWEALYVNEIISNVVTRSLFR